LLNLRKEAASSKPKNQGKRVSDFFFLFAILADIGGYAPNYSNRRPHTSIHCVSYATCIKTQPQQSPEVTKWPIFQPPKRSVTPHPMNLEFLSWPIMNIKICSVFRGAVDRDCNRTPWTESDPRLPRNWLNSTKIGPPPQKLF